MWSVPVAKERRPSGDGLAKRRCTTGRAGCARSSTWPPAVVLGRSLFSPSDMVLDGCCSESIRFLSDARYCREVVSDCGGTGLMIKGLSTSWDHGPRNSIVSIPSGFPRNTSHPAPEKDSRPENVRSCLLVSPALRHLRLLRSSPPSPSSPSVACTNSQPF